MEASVSIRCPDNIVNIILDIRISGQLHHRVCDDLIPAVCHTIRCMYQGIMLIMVIYLPHPLIIPYVIGMADDKIRRVAPFSKSRHGHFLLPCLAVLPHNCNIILQRH